MKAKVTNHDIHNVQKKVNSTYWKVENWINEVFIPYARIPVFVIWVFLTAAAVDNIYHGDKRDLAALPAQVQTKLSELDTQANELRQYVNNLGKEIHPLPDEFYRERNREIRAEINAIEKIKYQINEEIRQIVSQAPHKSWGRDVLNFIKETAWNIKSN